MTNLMTQPVTDVRRFAEPASGELKTSQLQRAIDACSDAGGGTIFIPPGVYPTGTLRLRSNITLHLAAGAVLLGSDDLQAYAEAGGGRLGMLYAADCRNIAIEGQGAIDGNGRAFVSHGAFHFETGSFDPALTRRGEAMLRAPGAMQDGPVAMKPRPGQALVFERCRRVVLRDVTIQDTPHWATNFSDCDDVRVSGVCIEQDLRVPNSDGIHFNSCRDMIVSECIIRAGDDAIALTSYTAHEDFDGFTSPAGSCGNLMVTNCLLVSRSAAIKIGPGQNDISDVTVSNVVIRDSNRGLLVWQRDGSTISDLCFSNITIQTRLMAGGWWGKGEPLTLSSLRAHEHSPRGRITRVRLAGITARAEAGAVLWADHGCRIDDVTIADLSLSISDGPHTTTHGGNIDLRNCDDKHKALFASDLAGVLCRGVRNMRLRDIDINWIGPRPPYFTDAFRALDSDVRVERLVEHHTD